MSTEPKTRDAVLAPMPTLPFALIESKLQVETKLQRLKEDSALCEIEPITQFLKSFVLRPTHKNNTSTGSKKQNKIIGHLKARTIGDTKNS